MIAVAVSHDLGVLESRIRENFLCIGLFISQQFEFWRYAAHVTAPTLLIAAEHDEVIPRASTEALYRRFRSSLATLQVVRTADHNSISESPQYVPLLSGTP